MHLFRLSDLDGDIAAAQYTDNGLGGDIVNLSKHDCSDGGSTLRANIIHLFLKKAKNR